MPGMNDYEQWTWRRRMKYHLKTFSRPMNFGAIAQGDNQVFRIMLRFSCPCRDGSTKLRGKY